MYIYQYLIHIYIYIHIIHYIYTHCAEYIYMCMYVYTLYIYIIYTHYYISSNKCPDASSRAFLSRPQQSPISIKNDRVTMTDSATKPLPKACAGTSCATWIAKKVFSLRNSSTWPGKPEARSARGHAWKWDKSIKHNTYIYVYIYTYIRI